MAFLIFIIVAVTFYICWMVAMRIRRLRQEARIRRIAANYVPPRPGSEPIYGEYD
jgi:hypothetical protein